MSILKQSNKEKSNEIIDNTKADNSYVISDNIWKEPKNYKKVALISASAVLATIIIIFAIITILNITSNSIFNNIKIAGIDISQMNKDEAMSTLQNGKKLDDNTFISVKLDNVEFIVKAGDIGAMYNYEEAVERAYSVARKGNILIDNYNFLKTLWAEEQISLNLLYDEEKLNAVLENINKNFSTLINTSYEIKDDELIIKKGKAGMVVDKDTLKSMLIESLQNGSAEPLEIPMLEAEPEAIDIEQIHKEIYKEAKDAYYTTEPFEIFKEEEGIDFAITMDEAKEILKEEKNEYIIPLKFIKPNKTVSSIGTEAFPDLLSTYSTTYITSKTNRTTNLKIAAGEINGHVLMPGETFSFNKVVGERTYAKGYLDAGVFVGGREEDGLAGGICQISSTLYNIVIFANLEIVSRTNHGMLPGYVSAGRDATVVYGAIDFVFKNNRSYPIKIETSVGGGYVSMKMYGTKEKVEYDVSFDTVYSATYYPSTDYIDTDELAPGKTKVETQGYKGYKSTTYKVLKLDGKVVDRVWLSSDVYNPMDTVILRGKEESKPVVTEPEPDPTPDPEPTPDPDPNPTPDPAPQPDPNPTPNPDPNPNPGDSNTIS